MTDKTTMDTVKEAAAGAYETASGYVAQVKDMAEDLMDDGVLNHSNKTGKVTKKARTEGGAVDTAVDGEGVLESVKEAASGWAAKISGYLSSMGESAGPTLQAVKEKVANIGHLTAEELNDAKEHAAPLLASAAAKLKEAAAAGGDKLAEAVHALGPAVSAASAKVHDIDLHEALDKVKDSAGDAVAKAKEALANVDVDSVVARVKDAAGDLADKAGDLKEAAAAKVSELSNSDLVESVKGKAAAAAAAVKDKVDDLMDGANEAAEEVSAKATETAAEVAEAVEDAPKKKAKGKRAIEQVVEEAEDLSAGSDAEEAGPQMTKEEAEALVGKRVVKKASEEDGDDVVVESSLPNPYRILKPRSRQTRDFRPERLNLHVNDDGVIEKVSFA